jgi:ApbE superfamily uncharacterized protein (UPF0280 family)
VCGVALLGSENSDGKADEVTLGQTMAAPAEADAAKASPLVAGRAGNPREAAASMALKSGGNLVIEKAGVLGIDGEGAICIVGSAPHDE